MFFKNLARAHFNWGALFPYDLIVSVNNLVKKNVIPGVTIVLPFLSNNIILEDYAEFLIRRRDYFFY